MGPFLQENVMQLKAKQDFTWAHNGVRIESFEKGQEIETEDLDLIEVSVREGWAEQQSKAKPVVKKTTKKSES